MQVKLLLAFFKSITTLNTSSRGGVEDTRLEAKAKDTKKIRGQGQGQPFQFPRTEPLEAKDRNARGQGPRTQALAFF